MLRGQLAEALALLRELVDDQRWHGQPLSLLLRIKSAQSLCTTIAGDRAGFYAACHELLEIIRDERARDLRRIAGLFLARRFCIWEDWPAARSALDEADKSSPGDTWPIDAIHRQAIDAYMLLNEGRLAEALTLLRDAVRTSSDTNFQSVDAFVRLTLARAELRAKAPQAARQALAPLLSQVGASGEIGELLQFGPAMLNELASASWGAHIGADELALLEHAAGLARKLQGGSAPETDASTGNDRLTEREVDVVSRIALGKSNKVIARELDLSPHTVKRHVARILVKLDVTSRARAGHWYLEQSDPAQARQ
jgi:LuxR family maltose regulon positive regulatory protein